MTRRRISATLCALVFLSAVAVGSAAPSKANRIGISVNSISATTQREMYYSTIKYAEAAGYQVVGLDSKGEVSKMFADMENLVAQRVDAIVNIGGNLTAMVPVIQRAARAGIPVISFFLLSNPSEPTGGPPRSSG
jgi:ABC-type sugar transport system substrate-binding protein